MKSSFGKKPGMASYIHFRGLSNQNAFCAFDPLRGNLSCPSMIIPLLVAEREYFRGILSKERGQSGAQLRTNNGERSFV